MAEQEVDRERELGERVRFTGTVIRKAEWGTVQYEDAPPPGFAGYAWTKPLEEADRFYPRTEGVIIGKRRYTSMQNDEGIWIPDGVQVFDAYLVAWHMRRNPVVVREDQIVKATHG